MILNVMNAVKSQLVSISVVNTQTVYNYGADIDKSAITVTATYKSGAMKEVSFFSISPQTATSSTITVSYSENGVTATATFNITILRLLESIVAVPNATEYEYAAAVGATTTAFYSDGSQATVTGTLSPTSAVAQNVNVSYTESGVTKTYSMPINVYPNASQYTSNSEIVNEGKGLWTMYCKNSGTLNLKIPYAVDVWCVGGGGGGGTGGSGVSNHYHGGGGGGGGYCALGTEIQLAANETYAVQIGNGGAPAQTGGQRGGRGGTSSALNVSGEGGYGGNNPDKKAYPNERTGGNGGSGGGAGASITTEGAAGQGGIGGSNGSNGGNDGGSSGMYGIGSGTSTKDFGEPEGTLRAGGGGGGRYTFWNYSNSNCTAAAGGAGGGGNGGITWWYGSGDNGAANYGGGGGGAPTAEGNSWYHSADLGGSGGSGIVIIRSHRVTGINAFDYTYSGISSYRQETNDNWYLSITGSGSLVVNEATAVDIYLLGGGQSGYSGDTTGYGQSSSTYYIGGAGGQGGFVNVLSNVTLAAGTYTATIGMGGTGNGGVGGTTILGSYQAPGGGSGASAGGTITAGAAGGAAGQLNGSNTPSSGGAGGNAIVSDFNGAYRGGGGGGSYSARYNSKSDDWSYNWAPASGGEEGGARSMTNKSGGGRNATPNYGGGGSGSLGSGSGGGAGSTGYILIRNHRA